MTSEAQSIALYPENVPPLYFILWTTQFNP
jgi:hypothetical protein